MQKVKQMPAAWLVVAAVLMAGALALASGLAAPAHAQSEDDDGPVQVSLVEWAIEMPTEVAAGEVTFEVTNGGSFVHNFEIENEEFGIEEVFSENLASGVTGTMTLDLQPGEYRVYCPVANHAARGMELTLTVSAADGMEAGQMEAEGSEAEAPGEGMQEEGMQEEGMQEEGMQEEGMQEEGMEKPAAQMAGQVARPGGDLPGDPSIELVKVADGLIDPVAMAAPNDGSGRLFVAERHGRIRIVQDGELLDEPFLDISDKVVSSFLEQGLYDIAFHPDFSENGYFFVHFSELMRNGDSMIVRYSVSMEDANKADPESSKVILQIDQPWANHNGGELEFGPDGYLYIGSGDGGWEGDPLEAGQNLNTLLGKILRIDVDVPEESFRPYAIPSDNPFAQPAQLVRLFGISEEVFAGIHTEAKPEIWAYGLRNPWQFSFDRETGDLYIGEVGQNRWEEINFEPAGSEGGVNYGWDFLMGSQCFPIEAESCPTVGTLPVAEYEHVDGNCSVTGIGVYRGDEFAALDGIYFAGDYCTGRVWGLAQDANDAWQFQELMDTDLQLTGGGEDADGNLYVTSCNCNYGGPAATENPPGALWRVVATDAVPEGAETASHAEGAAGHDHEHNGNAGEAGEDKDGEGSEGESSGEFNPGQVLAGPLTVSVQGLDNGVRWILPGLRELDPAVFGTPDSPKRIEEHTGIPLEQRMTDDDGTTTTAGPTPFSNQFADISGSFDMSATDVTLIDGPNSGDKVDFSASFTGPDGTEYELSVQKVIPKGPNHTFLGGVALNVVIHGTTGIGTPLEPTQPIYAAFWGVGTLKVDGEVVAENRLVHGMLGPRVRDDNYALVFEDGVILDKLNFHLILPPTAVTPDGPVDSPVPTGFELPNGMEQPFLHIMYDDISVGTGEMMSSGHGQ